MRDVDLGSVCEIKNGYAFKSVDFKEKGIPLIRISSFDNGPVFFDDKTVYVDEGYLDSKKNFKVEKGDVLIALSGATTGKYGLYTDEKPSLLNQRIGLLKSGVSKELDDKFFYYYLSILQAEIFRNAGGAAQPNISTKTISEFKIPLPPLDQQKKIASILDAADAYRQKTKALIKKYDELTKSLFLDMFGDPVANPKGWKKKPLQETLHKIIKIGKDYQNEYIEYVDIGSIDNLNNSITETTSYLLSERPSRAQQILEFNDIVFSTVRPNLKNIAINKEDGNIGSTGFFVCRAKKDILNNHFLFEILKSESTTDYFVGITSGANYPAVKSSDMKNFMVIIPPLGAQNQFTERVQAIEKQKEQAQASLAQAENLFNSLLQKAFKGELV